MALTITSSAFPADGAIPQRFSREGANLSPPIQWHGAPAGTRSFALIVEDPDAPKGTFRHWVAYNIPPDWSYLTEGAGSREQDTALRMGRNDFGNARYDGPQPPAGGGPHHYHFRLFALDVAELALPPQRPASDIVAAAKERRLGEADVVGTFERKPSVSRGIRYGIADADKLARTGSVNEPVRDTPPAGHWNDTARNE